MEKMDTVKVTFCTDCQYGKGGEFCDKNGNDMDEDLYPEIPKWCPLEDW